MKTKTISFLVVLLLVLTVIFTSCQVDSIGKTETEVSLTAEEGFKILAEAREAFFAAIPTSKSVSGTEIDYDNLSVKNTMIALAFEAYGSGDDKVLIDYLKKEGLYEMYLEIAEEYNVEEAGAAIDEKRGMETSRSVSSTFFNNVLNGEIILSINASGSGSIAGVIIPGTWKHSGIWDYAGHKSVSASAETNMVVGYEYVSLLITKGSLSVWRPTAYTTSKASGAVAYANTKIGVPFSFFTNRSSTNAYYCSKLVYQSWLSQGVNLEVVRFIDPWVTPNDLAYDGKTTFIRGDYIYPTP